MRDFGYDISDYTDIDPIFGTLADFDILLTKAHKLDIKILLDFVPNHTSNDHPWFKQSKLSKNNPKRDWYIWKSPTKTGGLPNNWLSQFGGPAWEFDKDTGEYYLHTFDVSQPDLNWRNEEVVGEILNVMRFWLARGVDGFRVDVAYHLFKDPLFRDEPPNPDYLKHHIQYNSLKHIYTVALPETLNMLKTLNKVLNEFDDRFMVCEIYTFLNDMINLYKFVNNRNFAPFNFSFLSIPWNAEAQKKFVDEFDSLIGNNYFPTYVLGNHDQPRIATKLGMQDARTAALLQLTLRGIPFIYYGEEIGMQNVSIPPEKIKDPMAVNMKDFNFGRDPERSPMQWDSTKFGGFSGVEPWLPLEKMFKERNVLSEKVDKKSTLNLYKSLIEFRKTRKSLNEGKYIPLDFKNQNVFGFLRQKTNETTLVLVNFTKEKQIVELPKGYWMTILSTNMDIKQRKENRHIQLLPSEGVILTPSVSF